MIFVLLFSVAAFAQPQWISIANRGNAYQYFRYGDGKAVEGIEKPAVPLEFHFPAPPAPARKVCAIENRPGVYWYTPEGRALNHSFPTPNPSEFRVSALHNGVRGFGVMGAFLGSAKRTGAVEAVYFADRECSDGSVEYGFSRDLATDSILVYWATYANCGNDSASLCRKTDDAALGRNFSNVQQEDSGPNVNHGFRLHGLTEAAHLYKMYVEGEGFRVEVWNGGELAQCSETPGGKRGPCSFWKSAGSWFPLDRIGRGYIIAGSQTAGDPQAEPGSGLFVTDILVEK